MENQGFNINECDELNKQKILNTALIKELRNYKEENTKLKHEKEILYSKIEKLEKENKSLKNDTLSIKNKKPLKKLWISLKISYNPIMKAKKISAVI